MQISVVIITYKRLKQLKDCLESLWRQDGHPFKLEVFIVLNGGDPETQTFLSSQSDRLTIINSKNRTTPAKARNLALKEAMTNEYILFLDDDITLPQDYFKKCSPYLEQKFDVFGGPDTTAPNATLFQSALGLAQQSPLSSAHTRYRHQSKQNSKTQHIDGTEFILCNLWIKSDLFKDHQLKFDERFYRNEENVLIHQIKKKTCHFGFAAEAFVYHQKKNNYFNLYRAVSSSARHRLLSFVCYPDSFDFLYTVPAFFVLYLLALPIFADLPMVFAPLALYLTLAIFFTLRLTLKNAISLNLSLHVFILQICLNLFYGIGFLLTGIKLIFLYFSRSPRSIF